MSENKDTKNTASIAENAVLANEKRGFPFRKIIFALLVVVVVLSIFLLILNIVINSYFGKITIFDGKWEVDAEKVENMPKYKDNVTYYMANEKWHAAYDAALLNYAQATSNMVYDDTVYN